jgi:hypothetical protein
MSDNRRVIAWEPVPVFRALLSHNLARNGLTQLVTVRPTVVAHPAGSKQVCLQKQPPWQALRGAVHVLHCAHIPFMLCVDAVLVEVARTI